VDEAAPEQAAKSNAMTASANFCMGGGNCIRGLYRGLPESLTAHKKPLDAAFCIGEKKEKQIS
jgi:hypothetical protein